MPNPHTEDISTKLWNQSLNLQVTFNFYAGYPGSQLDPPCDDEIEILKVIDLDSRIDLTDYLTEKKKEHLYEVLWHLHEEYLQQAAAMKAEYLYELKKERMR